LLKAFVPSFSVEPTREHVDHCEKVFCKLFATPALGRVCLVEKDESGCRPRDNPLDELDTESCKAVPVGHHNFPDQSLLDVLQKPREAFPFVIETGRNILVDGVGWELGLQRLDLSFQVVCLFPRRHSTVDGSLSRFLLMCVCNCATGCECGLYREVGCVIDGAFGSTHAGDVEASLSTRCKLIVDEILVCPCPHCVAADTECCCGLSGAK
jgi:hypothetical protein